MTSGKRTPGSTAESQVAATAASSNPPTPAPTAAVDSNSSAEQSTTMDESAGAATIINKPEEDNNSTQKQKISVEQNVGAEEEMTKSSKKQQQQRQQRPEEYIDGLWEADPFYYCSNGPTTAKGAQQFYVPSLDPLDPASERRHKRGLVYKSRDNGGATNEYECFQCHEGVIYRPGDQVFVESTREEPWLIGSIVSFKMKKRDQLLVKLIRYYRPNDVPELSFSLIHQERIEEGHYNHLQQPTAENSPTATAAAGTPPVGQSHHSRELFSSESTLLFHVSALRGKCTVKLVKDLRAAQAEIDLNDPDSFFNCLNYNQESGRLATVQMTIRVGSAHQAEVPSCSSSSLSDEPDRDELLYRPGYLCAETEQRYVKMARTFRTFSLMNNKRITMLEKSARTGDLLLDDALTTLHRSGYSIMEAISTMQAIDQHLTSDSSFMSADDVKKFGKGIKQYGKNFNKINKELLPHHRREQLVAFYYLWKKSRDATRPKPLSTAKRNQVAVGRRGKNGNGNGAINGNGQHFVGITGANSFGSGKIVAENGNPTAAAIAVGAGQAEVKPSVEMLIPPLEDLMDYASASEAETDQLEQQPSGSGRACHHCFSSKSKDWHHAGRDRLLMCTDCRLFYKKYGQLRPVDRPSTVPPCLLANIKQESNEEDENEEPAAGNRIRTRGALAGRQHRPRRTPSSLEVGTEQRLRGTPQKLSAEEEQQQRRGTPLRNSVTKPGNGGRKRALKSGETDEPTPPKAKRQKKNAASPSSNVCSRTPSPGNQTEEAAPIKKKTPKKERKQKEEEKKKEKEVDEKLDEKDANAKEGTVTPPLNTGTEMKALPTTSAGSPCSSDPCSSSTGNSSASSAVNSSGNSPQQHHQMSVEEKQRADTLAAVDLAAMKKREPKTPQEEPPKPNPPTAAATIIAKKPVAKVEPLDTGKKESEVVAATGEIKPEEQQSPKEEQPIICVDSSSDEEWEQDQGTLGEEDCTEVYRTAEGKKDFEGKLIPPEARTILQRCLKRANGLTCARTDIAYLEPPERKQHNFQRRERDRLKKEQERAAKQQQLQKQQQMTAAAAAATTAGNAQPPMGGAAKKMEMPAEFGANPNTGGLLANGLPHPNASSVSAAQHPMAAMLMNGFGPLGHHLPAQIQPGNHSNTPAAANAPQTSTMPSGMPGIPQIPPHHPFAALAAAAAGHHPPNSAAAAHQHPLLGPAGLNPSAAAANASMIHQQEQALINAMLNDPRLMQQLQSYFQQQPQLLAGQTNQQQQMLQMQMLLGLQHQQEQKLMEQLQRQQQQQKQAAQAAAQQQQQRPQTAMHLNGQHPLMNGLTHHAATAGIGHKMSTGTAPTPGAHFGPHHQQQASATQQQQHKDSNAHAQQQQAAAAAMMSQLFGGAFPNPSQQVAMMAMQAQQQQQQQRLSMQQQAHHQQQGVPTTSNSTQGHPPHHGHPQHSVQQNHGQQQQNPSQNHQQQQQVAAQMAAEMAALTAAIQQQQHGQQNHQQQLAAMQQQQQIQQVMAIMNVSGLPVQEQRLLEEQIRVYLLNNHQQQQQMAAAAAAAQQQQAAQQAQNSAAQQQQAQQNAAQQQLLAFAAAGGAMPPGAEQIMAAAMAQQMALQQQQQSSSVPSAPTSSSTAAAAAHQAAGAFQQQLMQVMAMQQQQSNAQQQQAAQAHMLQQQMEMMVRRNQQQQEQHRR